MLYLLWKMKLKCRNPNLYGGGTKKQVPRAVENIIEEKRDNLRG